MVRTPEKKRKGRPSLAESLAMQPPVSCRELGQAALRLEAAHLGLQLLFGTQVGKDSVGGLKRHCLRSVFGPSQKTACLRSLSSVGTYIHIINELIR